MRADQIAGCVLTTEPIDWLKWPNTQPGVARGYYMIRDARLQLDLTRQVAKGFLGGYTDIASFSHQLNTNRATITRATGNWQPPHWNARSRTPWRILALQEQEQ